MRYPALRHAFMYAIDLSAFLTRSVCCNMILQRMGIRQPKRVVCELHD